MEITDIRVRKVSNAGKMKAVVSVIIDEAIAIHDIKVIEGDKGYFISMPNRRYMDGSYKDIVHPVNTDCRVRLQKSIIEKYEELLEDTSAQLC